MAATPRYATEAALCADFIAEVQKRDTWLVLPEYEGWDILLSRKTDGVQIGIQAKLKLNSIVVEQALEHGWCTTSPGPDYRAVLVPESGGSFSKTICDYLGITVLRLQHYTRWKGCTEVEATDIVPPLPGERMENQRYFGSGNDWHDLCPAQRCPLPEYIPDSVAGSPCPITLTKWKIGAIKLAIILEGRPLTRADFRHVGIDHRRWLPSAAGWLQLDPNGGGWIAGAGLPDFKRQHPANYEQIKADAAKWMPPKTLLTPRLADLALPPPPPVSQPSAAS